jgi:PAS domain S-box-containing protein
MIVAIDRFGARTYFNPACAAFLGSDPAEAENGWLSFVHAEDAAGVGARHQAAIEGRQPYGFSYRLRRHDGVYRSILERGSPIHAADGSFNGHVAFCFDTTELRAPDPALQEMEQEVRLLGLATQEMIWSWDLRSGRLIHNLALAETLGEMPDDYSEAVKWWSDRIHPEDQERTLTRVKNAAAKGRADVSGRFRMRRRDGVDALIDSRTSFVRGADGEVTRVVGVARDITESTRAEQAQARFARILEATSDVVAMAQPDGRQTYLNDAGRKLLGIGTTEPVHERHLSEMHPEWANQIVVQEGIPTAIRDGCWTGETALIDRSGHEIPVSQVILSHAGPAGVEFISTIIRDLSERKREEVARIEWANRYDAAIRASGQLLFDWNSQTGEITYAGDVERFLGYSTEEMAGGLERFRSMIHREDLQSFDEEIARVTVTRDPFRLGFRLHRKDGEEIAIDAKGYFFLDRQGRIGRMVGFFADVTSQKQAQEALARAHDNLEARVEQRTAELAQTQAVIRQRALQQETVARLGHQALAGAPLHELFAEAVSLIRATLKVDFCAMLELAPDGATFQIRDRSAWPENAPGPVPIGTASQPGFALLQQQPVLCADLSSETRFSTPDQLRESGVRSGIAVRVEVANEPVGVLYALALKPRAFSIDDAHYLESMGNVLNAAIDHQRAEESIRLAREQAESANRAKNEFLSRMSHELRTPLNAILGFAQLLELDSPNESQSESISHISRAGQHLLSLINEVLDIARIEAGRMALTPEKLDIPSFLTGVIDLVGPAAARRQITMTNTTAQCARSSIVADRQRLQQVMLNLLSNAVKYNRQGGQVTVTCAPAGDRLRICVTDTGQGLPPEKLERLFIPFERLGAESTEIEGTGIGLVLSQRIVAALDGTMGVESVVGEGTTFWVELPEADHGAGVAQIQPIPAALPPAPLPPVTRKLLYIEDQDLNLRLVERILRHRSEYHLLTAMQGGLALELARQQRPDLILLDLNLPDISGEEVLRRLKADAELQHVPVLMVSADAMGDRIERLMALGASGYITKPYKLSEFLQALDNALAQ